jgi:hypothetical protein
MVTIFRWIMRPFVRLEQKTYFTAIAFKRRQAHNAKYAAMKSAWENNPTFNVCRKFADGLVEIDMGSDPARALAEIEALLASTFFDSTAELLQAFEREVEGMIEFETNPVLEAILQTCKTVPPSLSELGNRATSAAELDFEHEAKCQLGLMESELTEMVEAYNSLIDALPDLRKGCKSNWVTLAIGIGGWFTGQAGSMASQRTDNILAAVAFEAGGKVLHGLIEELKNNIAAKRLDSAVRVFERIANWFQGACRTFAESSAERFDPIMRSFMAYEKDHEDQFLRALEEAARNQCSLKPVYERVYGKLGY